MKMLNVWMFVSQVHLCTNVFGVNFSANEGGDGCDSAVVGCSCVSSLLQCREGSQEGQH